MTPLPKEVEEYIAAVKNGEITSCNEQKVLVDYVCKVFETEELKVDHARIEKYLAFQQYFEWDLLAWEKFCLVLLLCVFDKTKGLPRFSELFVLCGRGTGKNGFLAYLAFCMLSPANDIPYYFVDICANSEDQAKTSFEDLYNIMEDPRNTKKLTKFFHWTKEEIVCTRTKSKLKYRTNNPKGKDGLRSGAVFFDEIHAYENWENINVFTTGLGKKPHPRKVYVTTNGDVREGPLDQLIEKSHKILSGEIPDNGFLPFICKLDNESEVHDSANWEKANPSLPYLPTLQDEMKREYADYLLDPVINNAFMTKRMNIPQGRKDTEVASWENILKTNGDIPDLQGKQCVCGIDFSKTTDFVSAFLLFKRDGMYYGKHHSWFCTASHDKHRIKIPLNEMAERGLLTIVNDVEINPTLIAEWIREQRLLYNIEKIAIDSYRYSLLSKALRDIGYDANEKMVKLVRPSDIMLVQPKINSLFVSNKLLVGDDPLFRWFTNNTKLEPAPNNNFKYGKIEPKSRKTDGFMAFVAAMTLEEELPEAQDFQFFEPIIF
jgi:phage terminase large subunit-like protein